MISFEDIGIWLLTPLIHGWINAYSAVSLASGSQAAVFSKNDIAALFYDYVEIKLVHIIGITC